MPKDYEIAQTELRQLLEPKNSNYTKINRDNILKVKTANSKKLASSNAKSSQLIIIGQSAKKRRLVFFVLKVLFVCLYFVF
jgi:hypothetical protein